MRRVVVRASRRIVGTGSRCATTQSASAVTLSMSPASHAFATTSPRTEFNSSTSPYAATRAASLGTREPSQYGTATLNDVEEMCRAAGERLGFEVECFQSNWEGALIDKIHEYGLQPI